MTVAERETIPLVRQEVKDVLLRSSAFRALDDDKRRALAHDMVNIGQYLADAGGETYGVPMAALVSDDAVRDFGADGARAFADPPGREEDAATAGERFDKTGAIAAQQGTQTYTDLIKGVDFPEFVSGLIQGVFQAIVDSSIQQMEAFAELVANVSKSVDQYMKDNISENQARDYLADRYPEHLAVDINGQQPRVVPNDAGEDSPLPDFFTDLGLDFPVDSLDEETTEQVLMPAARKQMAIDRQRMLLMMVLMGINRLVVTDGSIKAAVIFELDTTDTATATSTRTRNQKWSDTNIRKRGSWFSPRWEVETNKVRVNTVDKNESETTVEMKAKLTGDVNIRFKSETFPLDQMTTLLGVQEPGLPTAPSAAAEGGGQAA